MPTENRSSNTDNWVPCDDGLHLILMDESNSHYGWVFRKIEGSWPYSVRKATEYEMAHAKARMHLRAGVALLATEQQLTVTRPAQHPDDAALMEQKLSDYLALDEDLMFSQAPDLQDDAYALGLARGRAEQRVIQLGQARTKRVYIAGPMTGLPDFNFPAFNALAATMRAEGWRVENPAEHGHVDGAEWGDYLRYDIGRLATCEAIMLLPGWSKSKGANLEVTIARQLGMPIMLAGGAESADGDISEVVDLRAQLNLARTALDSIMHATDNSQDDGAHHENAYSLADHALNNIMAACRHHNVAPRSTITEGKFLGYFCKDCGALARKS